MTSWSMLEDSDLWLLQIAPLASVQPGSFIDRKILVTYSYNVVGTGTSFGQTPTRHVSLLSKANVTTVRQISQTAVILGLKARNTEAPARARQSN